MSGWLAILLATLLSPGQEPPELPERLTRDEALVGALGGLADRDPAKARAAAEQVLARLAAADPELEFPVLVQLGGRRLVPEDLLEREWARLDRAWRHTGRSLRGILESPETAGGSDRVSGAIQAAPWISFSPGELHEVVRRISRHLDHPGQTLFARTALQRITLRDFRSEADFLGWWSGGASDRTQREWWREAAQRHRSELVDLWGLRIRSGGIADVKAALQSELFEVRRLGLEAMRNLQNGNGEQQEEVRAALQFAYAEEKDPGLRAIIVELAPRLLDEEAAQGVLEASLKVGVETTERVAAARALQFLSPPEAAFETLLGEMNRMYSPGGRDLSADPAQYRTALLGSLVVLAPAEPVEPGSEETPDPGRAAMVQGLVWALESEWEPRARRRVYDAAGRVGDAQFREVLLAYARDARRTDADRGGAIEALSRLPAGPEENAELLALLHGLLEHPSVDLRYQVIIGLRRLKSPESVTALGARLKVEPERGLVQEILRTLSELPAGSTLGALLEVRPPDWPQGRTLFLTALRTQIGGRADRLALVVEGLRAHAQGGGQGIWALAFALADGFPKDELDAEQQLAHKRAYGETLARWLLEEGIENGRKARSVDAVQTLTELMDAEPAETEWPKLLAGIHEQRGEPAEAFEAWKAILAQQDGAPDADPWGFLLSALEAARDAGLKQEGLALLAGYDEPPAMYAEAVAERRDGLEALPDPPPPPEVAEEGGTPQPEEAGGEPDAGAGGGAGADPSAEKPGGEPDAGGQGGEGPDGRASGGGSGGTGSGSRAGRSAA